MAIPVWLNSHLKKASVSEVKNNHSALIHSVQGGSPVLIVDRGLPADRLAAAARKEGFLLAETS